MLLTSTSFIIVWIHTLVFVCIFVYLPGSVRQKAAMCSPEASLGRYFCFWASLPAIRMPWNNKQLWAKPHEDRTSTPHVMSHKVLQHNRRVDVWALSFMYNMTMFTFSPMAWCAASVTAIEPSNEMISASRAYTVLDNPRPPEMKQ